MTPTMHLVIGSVSIVASLGLAVLLYVRRPRKVVRKRPLLLTDRRGAIAVEAALTLPVFALLMMGGLNYGIATVYKHQLDFATESASRCAGIGLCENNDQTLAYAQDRANLAGASFTVSTGPCGAKVDASYPFNLIAMFPSMTLTASGCYPVAGSGALGPKVKVAQLPPCDPTMSGELWRVTDALNSAYESNVGAGQTVQGGGQQLIPVICDATDPANMHWTAH